MTVEEVSARKARYADFCSSTYVPIYSLPWWMDAVCGSDNWGVWLHESGGGVDAAMPYYLEEREHGLYITKAPLTQNNGIVFRYPQGQGAIARAKFEERVVREAMAFVDSLGLAVYEQQYQTSFTNWLPFSWLGCEALTRYTYVIEDTSDLDAVWAGMSSSYRKNIKKGRRNGTVEVCDDPDLFYREHSKVFERQGLPVPFGRGLWGRLWSATGEASASRALISRASDEAVASVLFLVWDERRVYHLLGGTMPGYNCLETYNALTWEGIRLAHEMGLAYDFEGSMIERISKSFREFGGVPESYFRVRRVYSPEVIRMEAELKVKGLEAG
ncbi:GNAT family N-acetyltransferase [Collinsella ihumii]|uniref:GNAT family N-acetyltransferase n=1 Tax=Collinsella ihumii TaxID=1720204 RepID=A0AAW7JR12_9ACTN|nr:GNAT family N-acetyltransferase [Collinsella ihumii]MDN0069550.1 GNAT family N-acetyltransferase [Collinsella ihumii]